MSSITRRPVIITTMMVIMAVGGHKKKRSWKQRAKDKGFKQGRGRGGYGYRRDGD
jgi:hypothetical protein